MALTPARAGQTFTYQFEVPWGRPSLNLALQLADANYGVQGWLVDPNGQPVDVQSTTERISPTQVIFGPTMQFFHRHPRPGLWTVILTVVQPVNGEHLSSRTPARSRSPRRR